ncbi:DUF664 domain-containing protein [Streptomyces litmocidini]|uniref:DUF664 domain-containing protein n=1 Tax=Streptomyces litmocidini TaxID=67318 RepID=A0ABW7TXA7_9ACTN
MVPISPAVANPASRSPRLPPSPHRADADPQVLGDRRGRPVAGHHHGHRPGPAATLPANAGSPTGTNTHGLTDEQARMTASVGESGIGGPIRHAARCETFWTGLVLPQRSRPQRKAAEARPDPWFRPREPGR